MYFLIPRLSSKSAIPRMITYGYINIRWNQQSLQGTNPAISEKKREPLVATDATKKAKASAFFLMKDKAACKFLLLTKREKRFAKTNTISSISPKRVSVARLLITVATNGDIGVCKT
jgi:hypothetical protein